MLQDNLVIGESQLLNLLVGGKFVSLKMVQAILSSR